MLWVLSTIISIGLIILAGYVFFNKKIGSFRMGIVTLCIFAAAYVTYLPALLIEKDGLSGVLGNFIYTIQIMTIDADFFEYHEIIKTATSPLYIETL